MEDSHAVEIFRMTSFLSPEMRREIDNLTAKVKEETAKLFGEKNCAELEKLLYSKVLLVLAKSYPFFIKLVQDALKPYNLFEFTLFLCSKYNKALDAGECIAQVVFGYSQIPSNNSLATLSAIFPENKKMIERTKKDRENISSKIVNLFKYLNGKFLPPKIKEGKLLFCFKIEFFSVQQGKILPIKRHSNRIIFTNWIPTAPAIRI